MLDDGPFTFRKVSEGQHCEIELTGPSDPQTGIQYPVAVQTPPYRIGDLRDLRNTIVAGSTDASM